MKGLFVSFEGVECSGKSLQCKLLYEYCLKHKIPVILVREPGGTPLGEKLRDLLLTETSTPLTEFFIFSAARSQLTETKIIPHLEQGFVVISDRYFHSSLVYQGFGRHLDQKTLREISQIAVFNRHPDITFLLNPPLATIIERLQIKHKTIGLDRIERENKEFHEAVWKGYQKIALEFDYIQVIDASSDPESIHVTILNLLAQKDKRFN